MRSELNGVGFRGVPRKEEEVWEAIFYGHHYVAVSLLLGIRFEVILLVIYVVDTIFMSWKTSYANNNFELKINEKYM